MEAVMHGVDRVALVAWAWFILWIVGGDVVGRWLNTPGTGMVFGFLLALVTVFLWPWLMPSFIDEWMHDPSA
jgi:hypothetical protein